MFSNVFKDKTVLVTGHTGFKGSWLCIWLKELGANVVGYALEPYTERDNFVVTGLQDKITHIIGDIRDFRALKKYSKNTNRNLSSTLWPSRLFVNLIQTRKKHTISILAEQ